MKPLDFSTFPVLETDRLVLRKLSLEDAPVIYQLRSDVEVAALTGKAPFLHVNEAIAYINKIDKLINNDESIYWVASYKGDHAMIGAACLWNFDIQNETAEMGYELLPEFQGKGIMVETITRILKYAFEVIGIKTIVAFPSIDNPPSIKLLEKMGFEIASEDYQNTHIDVPGMLCYILTSGTK
ncbi:MULTISPECIES: GNAT family N-acetyltransferase [unclassified Pedobacter]|uniref:GNAT family N-acetyltransferase n=1 Tax=unclassified Pedobacter TaxID=2628915 RepID=UPI00141E99A2|nr:MULTISPECIES: GNAT family N-acetyltransferase [unclassified Pedobacter]NII81302.1 ribosomal-protein-alanine N-acetyltransferase [Pedobacter sp. SG908]NMN35308.1 ribosomal-protein-alanine N-acetyltransferase [Pedobacter sp. SG918]